MIVMAECECSRVSGGRETCLEGLISHKNVSIKREAKLALVEVGQVCLRMLAVCKQKSGLDASCSRISPK